MSLVEEADAREADVLLQAIREGVKLQVSRGLKVRSNFRHWMFNDADGRRLLDFWPSTGRYWCPLTGAKGKTDVWRVMDLVLELLPVNV